jgi:hypothetical protein
MPYFYEKLNLICPACGTALDWQPRSVFQKHPDRMSVTHPIGIVLADGKTACPNNGRSYYAPGIELSEIPVGK